MGLADPLAAIELDVLQAARQRLRDYIVRTPLLRLSAVDAPADIYLKLETLQTMGSFKLRGAANALLTRPQQELQKGVVTASAGNMAQGVGWMARRLGIPFTVIIPDHAPETKKEAIRSLGGTLDARTFREWWQVLDAGHAAGVQGAFVHPVCDAAVMAGNGSIGLEILEDLPDVDAILIPFGGGGLTTAIASAIRALRPQVKIFACEVETAAPLRAALQRGEPVEVDYQPSFVDGIGGHSVLPQMWPALQRLVDGALLVSVEETAAAVRLLAERSHVVAEGAGAVPVAAALRGLAGSGKVACVVSGGNIDTSKLCAILAGQLPP
jgi:threonine dehydratase